MTDIGKGYISMSEISEKLGRPRWSTQRVRRWMIKHNCAVKIGQRHYVSRAKFRDTFPEIYDDLCL